MPQPFPPLVHPKLVLKEDRQQRWLSQSSIQFNLYSSTQGIRDRTCCLGFVRHLLEGGCVDAGKLSLRFETYLGDFETTCFLSLS